MSRPLLRLLADDLTGALDSAAELAGLCGPVRVAWDGAMRPGAFALDTATREPPREVAVARLRALAPALAGADIAFKKIDSLLRGHVAAELAALMGGGAWTHCILAPAFPAQGRVTRGGRVLARRDGGWSPVPLDLVAALRAEGLRPRLGAADAPLASGLLLLDAERDADLARIVELGRGAGGRVLWCGSGGLARALAGGAALRGAPELRMPVLGLFGSDQAVTARQLAACGPCRVRLVDGGAADAARVGGLMTETGAAMVDLDLPEGLGRADAAHRIGAAFAELVRALPRPGTLIAAGGETLRSLCDALGAEALDATGLVAPGVPRSTLCGGAWDGVEVVSKSGGFGGDTLWRDLLARNGLNIEGIPA